MKEKAPTAFLKLLEAENKMEGMGVDNGAKKCATGTTYSCGAIRLLTYGFSPERISS